MKYVSEGFVKETIARVDRLGPKRMKVALVAMGFSHRQDLIGSPKDHLFVDNSRALYWGGIWKGDVLRLPKHVELPQLVVVRPLWNKPPEDCVGLRVTELLATTLVGDEAEALRIELGYDDLLMTRTATFAIKLLTNRIYDSLSGEYSLDGWMYRTPTHPKYRDFFTDVIKAN